MSAATAVGFEMGHGEIRSGLWLCLPIVKLKGDDRRFLARRIDWTSDAGEPNSGLTSIDDDELDALGVALPVGRRRTIESGWALAVMGDEFAKDLADAEIDCPDNVAVAPVPDETYAIGLATVESFERFRETICRSASRVFDKALSSSAESRLGPRGRAALRLLRHSSYRRSDLAVRELAAAIVSGDMDLLRRLLTRYSIELEGESRESLEAMARQHIGLCGRWTLIRQPLDAYRAESSEISREVNWKQMQVARSLPLVDSNVAWIEGKQASGGLWSEYTHARPVRSVAVAREVNKRRTVEYVEKG